MWQAAESAKFAYSSRSSCGAPLPTAMKRHKSSDEASSQHKSILKASSQQDHHRTSHSTTSHHSGAKVTTFDEKNLEETLHPANKDYGHMHIDEPKTPYVAPPMAKASDPTNKSRPVDPHELNARLLQLERDTMAGSGGSHTDEEFISKRRRHYDEGKRLREAKRMLEEEGEKDDDDGDDEER